MSTTFKSAINLVNYLSVQAFVPRLCPTESTSGDRAVRELQHPKSRAEEIRDELMPDVDLDESQLELFAQYVTALEGESTYKKNACGILSMLIPIIWKQPSEPGREYAEILKQNHQDFQDRYHVTNCLAKALREGWKPH
jgi:hypothetical protein